MKQGDCMTANRFSTILSLLAAITFSALPAHADRDKRWDDNRKWQKENRRYESEDKRGYILDSRHKHNRYYPKHGAIFNDLPRGYRTVKHRNERYYFYNGIWYRSHQNNFLVSIPPVGLTLSFLPDLYTTIWFGNLPYYYAAGVYYRWLPRERVYEIIDPPKETEIIEPSEMPEQLFIYPKERQSEQMQADDRYECHRWSSDQTGFNPSQSSGGVPERLYDSKKADYQRAMKACLEARGYSVQ